MATCMKENFVQMDCRLADLGELSLENIFIDGTMDEKASAAEKYHLCTWYRETEDPTVENTGNIRRIYPADQG